MMKKILYISVIVTITFILNSRVNAWSKYEIGEKVTYKGIDFYVIKNSNEDNDIVTMLKAEPLSVEEVNLYGGVGTENNYVNKKTRFYRGEARDINGYGGVAFYSSDECNDDIYIIRGCVTDYKDSDVKVIVDEWASDKLDIDDLVEDKNGYKVRLLSIEDLSVDLGYNIIFQQSYIEYDEQNVPKFVFNKDYITLTMSSFYDEKGRIWLIHSSGSLVSAGNYSSDLYAVRPVVTLKKSALGDINEQEDINKDDKNTVLDNNSSEDINVITKTEDSKVSVNVPNTMQRISVVLIMAGIVLVSISIVIIVKNKDKLQNK